MLSLIAAAPASAALEKPALHRSRGIIAAPSRFPPCSSTPSALPLPPCCSYTTTIHRSSATRRRAGIAYAASAQAPTAPRLQAVLDRIDKLNSQDSRTTQVEGEPVPYELAYSRWLTGWALQLTADSNPPPSEELLIVARGQHVQRWVIPRSSYPEGRTSYLKWREDLKKFHAKTVTSIMSECGYDAPSCSKVESMILKKNLKEAESQTIEDALCLVFLQYQLSEFRAKEVDEKTVDIIRKTWKKMGDKGKAAALALAPSLPAEDLALVQQALA